MDLPVEEPDKHPMLRQLIIKGTELSGSAAGATIGFFAGGPLAAAALGAAGAAAQMALNRVGTELADRILGPREKVRVGAVLALASNEFHRRIKNGDELRDDGFFDMKSGSRPDSDEVAEAVLLKCQRDAEERKLPYMAHMLSGIAFDSTVDAPSAHMLIKTAEALTYRQLCILQICAIKDRLSLRESDYRGGFDFTQLHVNILHDYCDLESRNLISGNGEVIFGLTDINPSVMGVQATGAVMYNLMKLENIPEEDLLTIIDLMKK